MSSDKTEFKQVPNTQPENGAFDKRPCLIMIEGDFIGTVYELKKDVTILGRNDDVEIVLSDTLISRKHAMIEDHAGIYYYSDLGSTNGCLHNKQDVLKPTRLSEGDKIGLGSSVFKFSFHDNDDSEYHVKMRNMAVKDGLTNIYNKRYFLEMLNKEFEFNRRSGSGLAMILFDIDHFKAVNDNIGHTAGDYALKELAQLIEKQVRDYDLFARYGGEEFVFLLKGNDLGSAITFAERVRVIVEQHNFNYCEQEIPLTISLGVIWWSGNGSISNPEDLIKAADTRLYQAKNSGRNCVRFDSM